MVSMHLDAEAIEKPITPPPAKRRRVDKQERPCLAPSIPPKPLTELSEHFLRIFSWNVNGISAFLQPTIKDFFKPSRDNKEDTPPKDEEINSHDLRKCFVRWKWPQVIGLQEVKIRRGDERTMAMISRAVKGSNKAEPSYKAFFSLPRDKYNAKGRGGPVYGVAMFVREDILDSDTTVTTADWDLEGRVLILKMPKQQLAVFNVYAVNGTENPWHDSKTGQIKGTRHDKKRELHTELRDAGRKLENQGWSVVIAGDINIARSPVDGFPGIRLGQAHVQNRADFEAKFMEGDNAMIDTFRQLHGNEKKYSYRGRNVQWGASCDRVDLILASGNARQGIIEADILDTVQERGPSDHVPIYTTLDLEKLGSHRSLTRTCSSSSAEGMV